MTHTPLPRRSAEEEQRVDAALRELFDQRIRFNEVLGLRTVSMDPQDYRMQFEMRPDLIGHYLYGRLHGGVIASALDAAGGNAVMVGIAHKHADETAEQILHRFARIGTIDLRIDYLRPGLGSHFIASAVVTKLGGRVASVQMRLSNEAGVLIATGAAAYIVS
ncbi:thioesterase family protein [Leptothrix discophora]|uniref:Thioesterase family protein n=1 Tax=Leptothrix discophora TaxID=89 RepID=A0ABT9FZK3_LEPDI|nr:thioesterase family protein [Leptothrix discophora]MDP4299591.1 thioesterase family protein [Leptothrix discophora]